MNTYPKKPNRLGLALSGTVLTAVVLAGCSSNEAEPTEQSDVACVVTGEQTATLETGQGRYSLTYKIDGSGEVGSDCFDEADAAVIDALEKQTGGVAHVGIGYNIPQEAAPIDDLRG